MGTPTMDLTTAFILQQVLHSQDYITGFIITLVHPTTAITITTIIMPDTLMAQMPNALVPAVPITMDLSAIVTKYVITNQAII